MTVKLNRVGRTVKTFLAFVLILSVVVSVSGCRNDDDVSETESAVVEGGITVTLPGFESANFLLNLPASDGADVLYDRNYTVDGSFSFFVSLSAGAERTLVSVKASDNDGVTEYTVSEILSGSDGGELYIPVNGFVLSIGKNIGLRRMHCMQKPVKKRICSNQTKKAGRMTTPPAISIV